MGILGRAARERFLMPGGQRSRLLHACCLRRNYSLRKVLYPPAQTREEGQEGHPPAWSASSAITGASGTLQIHRYCVRLMHLRAIWQFHKFA